MIKMAVRAVCGLQDCSAAGWPVSARVPALMDLTLYTLTIQQSGIVKCGGVLTVGITPMSLLLLHHNP